ncbi:low molecular weight protein-tyrosine-phosphatase [Sphingobacterium sp. SYP-B4668]|uniref:low molecular weight protein-tyrosine-phosphatase n=1 Tax=Sphingobacterium sp. SYP-B4668 TaxID=2996035 RepID=UPI0022DE6210|nr:low molecular weight protein-tyrosine-phosphatase [Sphingobacterium sp. SYP-B4668]
MKILMVCLGNICRSPLAHGILQHLAQKHSLDWEIDSAGTGDWHIGHAPDHRSITVASKYGVDISQQRAQHFHTDFFEYYDRIFVMDEQNYKDVIAQATTDVQREKVTLFIPGSFVPDPYFDAKLFDPVYKMVEKRCLELIEELR